MNILNYKQNNIKAILFDMDWVLIDTNIHHFNAFNKAIWLYWYNITYSEHLEIYEWLPSKLKLKILTEKKWLDSSLYNKIIDKKLEYLSEFLKKDLDIDYKKQEMLLYLRDKWIKVACCSNATKNSLELILKQSGLYDLFDLIISNENVVNPKPNPEMYIKAIKYFWLTPQEVYILEDSQNWLDAAYSSWWNVLRIESVEDVNKSLFDNLIFYE